MFAVPRQPASLDPLLAGPVGHYVVRQAFEPLVSSLDGPYGSGTDRRGVALDWRASGDRRVWRFHLRSGVSFQDGTPLNASAVRANAERWRTTAAGRRLLPELLLADAPRPDLVRFVLDRPLPSLPDRLRDPRLGLVSPAALRPPSGRRAVLRREARAGSGAFELRGRPRSELTLARFRRWWGSALGLGPALDEIRFVSAPSAGARARFLRDGQAQVADALPRQAAQRLRGDPLLSVLGARSGAALGFERSLRGLETARPAPLSGIWIAGLEP